MSSSNKYYDKHGNEEEKKTQVEEPDTSSWSNTHTDQFSGDFLNVAAICDREQREEEAEEEEEKEKDTSGNEFSDEHTTTHASKRARTDSHLVTPALQQKRPGKPLKKKPLTNSSASFNDTKKETKKDIEIINIDSDSDSDSEDESIEEDTKLVNLVCTKKETYSSISSHTENESDVEDIIIDMDEANKKLQELFGPKMKFKIKSHQAVGIRKVANKCFDYPLHNNEDDSTNRGVLLADDMGLGKTLQAILGAIQFYKDQRRKQTASPPGPIVIVVPSIPVMDQWINEIKKCGVEKKCIQILENDTNEEKFFRLSNNCSRIRFVILTKFTLGGVFKGSATQRKPSWLFKECDRHDLKKIWKIQQQNHSKSSPEKADAIRKIYQKLTKMNKTILMSIIDEAHEFKNPIAQRSVAAAILTSQCKRSIAISGTPYNNAAIDLASVMALIDFNNDIATEQFWTSFTENKKQRNNNDLVYRHQKRLFDSFVLRREKNDNLLRLPRKTVRIEHVVQYNKDILIMESLEKSFLKIVQDLARLSDSIGADVAGQRAALSAKFFWAVASLKLCSVHKGLPLGREFTLSFSRSRSKKKSLIKGLKKYATKQCVFCNLVSDHQVDDNEDGGGDGEGEGGGDGSDYDSDYDSDFDSDSDSDDDDDDDHKECHKIARDRTFVPLSFCKKEFSVQHFAHKCCLEEICGSKLKECPRCCVIKDRYSHLGEYGDNKKRYCQDVNGGFVGSPKLDAIVSAIKNIPKGEKVVIFSGSKSVLDLCEGICFYDLKLKCSRLDGDILAKEKQKQLQMFKTDPNKKILLTTLHSGSVGLNLQEANHVFFVDRWFNPFLHDQAMDRCHRIGQTKDVDVCFFDSCHSIDNVFAQINEYKKQNASAVLTDRAISAMQKGKNLDVKNLIGLIPRGLEKIIKSREELARVNPSLGQIGPIDRDLLTSLK